MHLIRPGWKVLRMGPLPWEKVDGNEILKLIESDGRKCYKSEANQTETSYLPFVKARIKQEHIALLDHLHITAEYVCDRGVSHEWIRHKLTEILPTISIEDGYDWTPMAVVQESTRYCNYLKSGGVCFIIPPWVDVHEGEWTERDVFEYSITVDDQATGIWLRSCLFSELAYLNLLAKGWTPQQARVCLNIGVKTEFRVTCSLTEWRHIMKQRTSPSAHPQMREIMRPQLEEFKRKIPVIFDDITY